MNPPNGSYLAVRDADLKPTPIGTGLINNAVLRHWEFYAGDIWKLRPSLTVSYGLRYQWHTPPIDDLSRQTLLAYKDSGELIDPQDYLKRKAAAAANGDIFNPDIAYLPIKNAPQDGVFRINRKDFSPRVSAAWKPRFKSGPFGFLFGENKTVMRGGYSLLYDRVNTVSNSGFHCPGEWRLSPRFHRPGQYRCCPPDGAPKKPPRRWTQCSE